MRACCGGKSVHPFMFMREGIVLDARAGRSSSLRARKCCMHVCTIFRGHRTPQIVLLRVSRWINRRGGKVAWGITRARALALSTLPLPSTYRAELWLRRSSSTLAEPIVTHMIERAVRPALGDDEGCYVPGTVTSG